MEAKIATSEAEELVDKKLVNIFPITRQLSLSKLAHYCTNDNGADLYFFLEAIMHLRATMGDEILKEAYGENTERVKSYLTKSNMMMFKIKLFYDSLGNKELSDIDKENKIFKLYKNEVKKLSLFMRIIYEVFHLYESKTNLQNMVIPNEYFKKSERKYTTFDLKKSEKDEEEGTDGEE